MSRKSQYFVYEYSYPQEMPDPTLAGVVFYVGKATNGTRLDSHLSEAGTECDCAKCLAIRLVWDTGLNVVRRIVFESVNETEVINEERRRILLHDSPFLTNTIKTKKMYETKEVEPVEDEIKIFYNKHGFRIKPERIHEEFSWLDQSWKDAYESFSMRECNLKTIRELFLISTSSFASSTRSGYIEFWDELFEKRYDVENDPSALRHQAKTTYYPC